MAEKIRSLGMIRSIQEFRKLWDATQYCDVRESMLRLLKKTSMIEHIDKMTFFYEVLQDVVGRARSLGKERSVMADEFVLAHLSLAYLLEHVFKSNDNEQHDPTSYRDRWNHKKVGDMPEWILAMLADWSLYDERISPYTVLNAHQPEPLKRFIEKFLMIYAGMVHPQTMHQEGHEPDAWFDAVINTNNLDLFGDERFHRYFRAIPKLKAFISDRLRERLPGRTSIAKLSHKIVLSSCMQDAWRSHEHPINQYAARLIVHMAAAGQLDEAVKL